MQIDIKEVPDWIVKKEKVFSWVYTFKMNGNNRDSSMTAEKALIKNAQELQRLFDEHHRLLRSATFRDFITVNGDICFCHDCPYRRRFKETLINTIETLEETRRSFKSKKIEVLRRQLTLILSEEI